MIQIPPKMLGKTGQWITSILSKKISLALKRALRDHDSREGRDLLRRWEKRITQKVRVSQTQETFPIVLSGWKYLSRVNVEKIHSYYDMLSLTFKGSSTLEASWEDESGVIEIFYPASDLKEAMFLVKNGQFDWGSDIVENLLLDVLRMLQHELIHMAQAFLEVGIKGSVNLSLYERKPVPGLPAKRIMDRTITQNMSSDEGLPRKYEKRRRELKRLGLLDLVHDLDDAEFYTRLADEVFDFKRGIRVRGSKRQGEIKQWIGASRKATSNWFEALRKYNPAKWKKAVIEFTKRV